MTLPLIYTLNNSSRSEKRALINIVKNHSTDPHKVDLLIEKVKQAGGIDYAEKRMQEYIDKAQQIILEFPDTPSLESLKQLVDYSIRRQK